METHAKFVSPQDFKNYWGIDLGAELKDNGTEVDSNKADMFLMRIEDRLLAWLDSNTFRTYRWDEVCGPDRDSLQKAIIVQAMYVFRNGDISTDSGYDPQRGKIINKADLQAIEICDEAIDILKSSGLYSRAMVNRRRYRKIGMW